MSLLYPSFLWLLLPLVFLLWRDAVSIQQRVHIMVLMLILLALSRPVEKQALQEASIKAKDIIIALDVSYSMMATDIKPTRYDFAKEVITLVLKENPSSNIMLIAFTSNPLLLSPPTTDHALINIALKSLNPEFILTKGTSLENLFKKLSSMKLGHKNLILMTDGGEEDNLARLIPLIEGSSINLTVLALGTTQGTTVKRKDGSLLKDHNGNLVISRINPLLSSLASSLRGTYLTPSSSAKTSAEEISQALNANKINMQEIQKMQKQHFELYQIPLALALLFFFMLHTRAVKYLLLLFALLGMPAQASFFDTYHLIQAYKSYKNHDFNATQTELKQLSTPSLQSQFTLANSYYKQGAYKQAIQAYKSIRSTSALVKQRLYYNIANAYVMLKAYDKAKIYYTKTLQLGEDADAIHNLKLISLLHRKKDVQLGIAHPKSQDASSSKSDKEKTEEERRNEDDSSSGSGGGGESQETQRKKKKKTLSSEGKEEKHPLSSKVYELINKGYVREKQPW